MENTTLTNHYKKMTPDQVQELLTMRRRKTVIPPKRGKGSVYKRQKGVSRYE